MTFAHAKDLQPFSLVGLMGRAADKYSSQIAFTCCLPNGMDASITFADVERHSSSFAAYLMFDLGIQKGDRVAIQIPNSLPYPIIALGVWKAGAVLVNTNPLYTASEMIHQFNDSGARVLILSDLFADKLPEVLKNTKIEKVILARVQDLFSPVKATIIGAVQKYIKKQIPEVTVPVERFEEVLQRGVGLYAKNRLRVDERARMSTGDDTAFLQYTGGTTGVSKGAMLTHTNLISNVSQVYEVWKSKIEVGNEIILTVLPLYHIFAFMGNFLTFYSVGSHSILSPSPRPLTNLKKPFSKYKITWFSGVNTLFNGLCNEEWFRSNPPPYLKASVSGGMALQEAVAIRWEQITKAPIVEGYGLTEASPVCSLNPLDGKVKLGSIGLPLPGTEMRCLDVDGKVLPRGEIGEVAVRGPQVMKGYWQRDEETKKVLRDGWLLTGDIGVEDEEGYFKIVDRKKDMILVSGFNVYPNEVEDVIAKLDEVAEVAVIGVPDDSSGETVKAFIVRRGTALTEATVKEHCKKFLTGYKCPKLIEFRTELPKTPVGKILRKDLRNEEAKQRSNT